MKRYYWLLALPLFLLFGGIKGVAAATLDGVEVETHQIPSKTCKECHKEIYKEWSGSMHAQSTALKDPIHGAFYRNLVGDPTHEGLKKGGKYPVCLQCHAPNAARDGTTKLDQMAAYSEGVNCVACHTLASYKGIHSDNGKMQLGIQAYTLSDQLQGPNGFLHEQGAVADQLRAAFEESGDLNPHLGRDNAGKPYMDAEESRELDLPMQRSSMLKGSQACLGCHDKRNNPNRVALCQTGDEYKEGKSRETCQSCHMPVVNGRVSHAMGGGHDGAMLKRAVRLDLAVQRQGEALSAVVHLENQQPHNLPTGAPFRNMVLKLTALSATGEVLWQNYQQHPMKEDPKAYLSYGMTDDQGKPAPPPKATKAGEDSRLRPFERRALNYQIDAKGVDTVRAELYYNLLWAGLVKKLKQLPDELKSPKRIAWAEAVVE